MVLTFSLETSEPELGFGSFSYAAVFRPVKCPLEITYIGLLVTACIRYFTTLPAFTIFRP